MAGNFTFAVIGRNEGERLHLALAQAFSAAGPDDRVWFVDSGSDDDSVARASAMGAEVVKGPVGKGAAIAVARDACDTEYICLVDGDMESSSRNIFAALRDRARETSADMIVGSYTEPIRRWAVTPGIYLPLVEAFFAAEHAAAGIEIPLSGLRAWRPTLDVGALPTGYGVETHLNLHTALRGDAIVNCELGQFVGPLRGFKNLPGMARDVAGAILDLAGSNDRLSAADRPAFAAWIDEVVAVIETMPAPDADATEYRERLDAAAARCPAAPDHTAR
jgi:glucosyl-3-phosphoglycerate synthase